MENATISKINKLGKAGDILCRIAKIAVLIALMVALVIGILMFALPRDAVKVELLSTNTAIVRTSDESVFESLLAADGETGILTLGDNAYQLMMDEGQEPIPMKGVFYLADMKWVLLMAAVLCAAAYIPLHYGQKICASLRRCETPFTPKIAKNLNKLAWSLIPITVLGGLPEGVSEAVFTGRLDIDIGLDVTKVLMVLCFFLLSAIFTHGVALQTEADETL